MMIALDLLRRYWKPAAVLTILILVWLHGHKSGADNMDAKWQAIFSKQQLQAAQARVKASEAARKQEVDWSAAFDIINTIQQESLADAISRRDRIIAGLRAGRLSFRPCSGVPEAPAHPGEPEAAPESGQSGVVGEAITARLAVCDEVTLERNQAVSLLEAERR